jgi:hypothetical protein
VTPRPHPGAISATALLLTLAGAPGCGGDSAADERGDVWRGTVEEVAAGRPGAPPIRVARNEGGGAWQSDTVLADTTLSVGAVEGAAEYLFGEVRGIAVDADGRIYVADWQGGPVRAYGPDGRFLKQITAVGDGPGETRNPTGLTLANGRLHVRDVSRIVVLQARAAGGVADSVVATWPLAFFTNWTSGDRSRLDPSGRYYYPHYSFRIDAPPRWFYLALDAGVAGADTLFVPSYETALGHRSASYRVSATGGRMLRGLSVAPFEPLASWDVTPAGTLISGDGAHYAIAETTLTGDTVALFSRTGTERTVAPDERADSMAALGARLDSVPVPLDRVEGMSERVRSRSLPDSVPAFLSVWSGEDGKHWIRRWPAAGRGGHSFFDVFDAHGIFLGVVVVPVTFERTPAPVFLERALYGVIRDPDTGVDRIVRAEFEPPAREAAAPAASSR